MTTSLGMKSPQTIDGMNVDALLQTVWENKAYLESVKPDPIFNNKDLIKPISVVDRQAVPAIDQFFINVTPKNTGARNITLAFISAFDMDPVEGNDQFIGSETQFDMKWTKCYANDWAGGVTLQNFGIDARELRNYGLNQESKALLYQWRCEILGWYARQALVEKLSNNLTASPLSMSLSLNNNWWFPSLADSDQPTYDPTSGTFQTSIGTAAMAAGMNATLSPSYLLQFCDYLENKFIRPVNLRGRNYWAMLISPREMRRLRDPSVTSSFGAFFKDAAAITDVNKVIPTAELVVADCLILIRDPRQPEMTITGASSSYGLGFHYDKAGRSTTKTSYLSVAGATNYWHLNTLLGAGSLMWYEPEKTHEENQPDEYTQYEGKALFGAIGYQTPVWNVDDDADDATTAQQESSFIVPTIKA
jgi:hypothetical protein